jgi:hypothetical protein
MKYKKMQFGECFCQKQNFFSPTRTYPPTYTRRAHPATHSDPAPHVQRGAEPFCVKVILKKKMSPVFLPTASRP